jgi:flagella basal body P-ring formation protein FlgA
MQLTSLGRRAWLCLIFSIGVANLAYATDWQDVVTHRIMADVLKKYPSVGTQEVKIEIQVPPDMKAWVSSRSEVVIPAGVTDWAGVRLVRIRDHASLRTGRSGWLRLNTSVFVSVPRSASKIPKGRIIGYEDLVTASVSVQSLPPNAISDSDLIVGKQVKSSIVGNSFIVDWMLRPPIVVYSGEPVKLEVKSDNMVLTIQGKAFSDGSTGETIWVQVNGFSKKIKAKVMGPNRVQMDSY